MYRTGLVLYSSSRNQDLYIRLRLRSLSVSLFPVYTSSSLGANISSSLLQRDVEYNIDTWMLSNWMNYTPYFACSNVGCFTFADARANLLIILTAARALIIITADGPFWLFASITKAWVTRATWVLPDKIWYDIRFILIKQ